MTTTHTAQDKRQNPFRVHLLRKHLRQLTEGRSAYDAVGTMLDDQQGRLYQEMHLKYGRTTDLTLNCAQLAVEAQLVVETQKKNVCRFWGLTKDGPDDAWRYWIVCTREFTSWYLSDVPADEVHLAAASLWESMGFDPSPTPQSAYSPTGRMFRHGIFCKVAFGHLIISQSGARDV